MENLNSSLNDWLLGRPLNVECSREDVGRAACCLTRAGQVRLLPQPAGAYSGGTSS